MKRAGVFILIFLNFVLFFLFFKNFLKLHSESKFKVKLLRFYRTAFPVDVDGDGRKELLVKSDYPMIKGKAECTVFKPFVEKSVGEFFGEFLFPRGFLYIGSLEENGRILYKFVGKEGKDIGEIVTTNQGKVLRRRKFETPEGFDEYFPFSPAWWWTWTETGGWNSSEDIPIPTVPIPEASLPLTLNRVNFYGTTGWVPSPPLP